MPARTPHSRPVPALVQAAVFLVSLSFAWVAQAAELLVVDQPDCPFCERFEREIAPAWPNTTEGKAIPLRRVGLHETWPEDLEGIEAPDLTPTFILVDEGTELGRLIGYRGDEHFWFLIGQLLDEHDTLSHSKDGPRTDATGR